MEKLRKKLSYETLNSAYVHECMTMRIMKYVKKMTFDTIQ